MSIVQFCSDRKYAFSGFFKRRFCLILFFKSMPIIMAAIALTGCTTTHPMQNTTNIVFPPNPQTNQFDKEEAMAMVEFCVDLDDQDDREATPHRSIYDMQTERYTNWDRILDSREIYAKAMGLDAKAAADPNQNGFKPFDSAWTLWKRKTPTQSGHSVYTLAFRGTIFSDAPSAAEDAIVTTIAGQYGLELPPHKYLPITFATLPRAEVHEGFAYAVFGALFDKDFGVLANIKNVIEPGSTLIITGHSQGAALATLAHAFFFYAAQDEDDRFGIKNKNLTLKSYVIAQPKPGNVQFMEDFARVTGGGANSFVFNNTLDPVPLLPPTHLFFREAFEDVNSDEALFRVFRFINNSANQTRKFFSGIFENKLASKIKSIQKKDKDKFFEWEELDAGSRKQTAGGYSQSYTSAGHVIPLPGFANGYDYYNNTNDINDAFIQHHATSYRRLLEIQYWKSKPWITDVKLKSKV